MVSNVLEFILGMTLLTGMAYIVYAQYQEQMHRRRKRQERVAMYKAEERKRKAKENKL